MSDYREIAQAHSLDPDVLLQIFTLRSEGLNNTEIATRVPRSRNAVNSYILTVKHLNPNEKARLIYGLSSAVAIEMAHRANLVP